MTHRAYTRVPAGPSWSTILPDMDFEAYSEAGYYWDGPAARWRGVTKTNPGIAAVGAPAYTEHPSTEVLSLAYDLKDGKPARLWVPGMTAPFDLFEHILAGGLLEAWNSAFEYYLWLNVCHARMGWPALPHVQLRCAMSKARAFSLPGKLGEAAKAIKAAEQKDTKGDALIRKLCIPRSPTKAQTAALPKLPLGKSLWYHPESGSLFVDQADMPMNSMDAALCTDITGRSDLLKKAISEGAQLPDDLVKHANRLHPATAPNDYADLYSYNGQDIVAEAAVSILCPDLSPAELEIWLLDQAINFRGVHIDTVALADCLHIVNAATAQYTAELQHITGGTVRSAGELEKIRGWLGANGVHTPNLDADAVEAALKRTDLTPVCRRVLEIRDSLGSASVKKLFAIERRLSHDSRLRDLLAYCGADRTGRWAGRGPQPQNLPSSGPKVCRCAGCKRVFWKGLVLCPACGTLRGPDADCDWGIEAVDAALSDIATRNLALVEARWGDAVAAVAGCLRGLFAAAPRHDLLCSDFSAIEAVVLAELAGEEWRQEVFRTHGKIYEMSASMITGIPFAEFIEYKKRTGLHHPMRKKIGKISELASGYQGAVGAWKAFGADAFMTDDEILENVKAWRKASPAIVKLWYGLQEVAHLAISNPGNCYRYQAPPTRFGRSPAIAYGVKNDILYCQLPSGRMLTYHEPRLDLITNPWGKPVMQMSYMGWNSNYLNGPVGWMRLDTHGGKLVENLTQAVARDILADRMPPLEAAGYPIVLHVHDEIVAEVPEGTGDVAEFERIMSTMPPWASGWPVRAAGGWRGKRYRKD